jgi:hypothetical protein
MRILYISVHEPLAYDEVRLFIELGNEVDVGGPNGEKPGPGLRPPAGNYAHWDESTLRNYEAIIVMHRPESLKRVHAARSPGQRIIWRTIGQSHPKMEAFVRHHAPEAEIVRYSPKERVLEHYAGETALIRFYKDPAEYNGWVGGGGIKMLAMGFNRRGFPDHEIIEETLAPFPWNLYGRNPGHPRSAGAVGYADTIGVFRSADMYVAAHSAPASYTLNLIEAMMTGAPVLAGGRQLVDLAGPLAGALFEVDDILDGCGVFLPPSVETGRALVSRLLNRDLSSLGEAARERAIALFGKASIKQQWATFLS